MALITWLEACFEVVKSHHPWDRGTAAPEHPGGTQRGGSPGDHEMEGRVMGEMGDKGVSGVRCSVLA